MKNTRKINMIAVLASLTTILQAQLIAFGVNGGVNYSATGDLEGVTSSLNDIRVGADNKAGFHLGGFAEVSFLGLYVRPEVLYTRIMSGYDGEISGKYTVDKVDIPLLVGVKILPPIRVFAGPALQYIINDDFDASQFTEIKKDEIGLGMQLGIGVAFEKIGFDIRWEQGLTETLSEFADSNGNQFTIDSRPSQLIFGVSYQLNY